MSGVVSPSLATRPSLNINDSLPPNLGPDSSVFPARFAASQTPRTRIAGLPRATIPAYPARGVITIALLFSKGAAWAAGATAAHRPAVPRPA
jgi:hypothetical protein